MCSPAAVVGVAEPAFTKGVLRTRGGGDGVGTGREESAGGKEVSSSPRPLLLTLLTGTLSILWDLRGPGEGAGGVSAGVGLVYAAWPGSSPPCPSPPSCGAPRATSHLLGQSVFSIGPVHETDEATVPLSRALLLRAWPHHLGTVDRTEYAEDFAQPLFRGGGRQVAHI
eukprot:CAMPEP_0114443218 /NCGR_PEP_ID=MMETSP0103-20121206/17399_1 /TAXON_ID=37642 ORGANISM="Paraphysomonas imperforata, Strain PA2" /NCGR_SAMPLE_ID=MMETSP0103 /ASSEMBLY_ACC=CAM_ASM_000201 /LENGTH=168 /DNA_ID=CAMNT_0001614601 /DNA_START=513 /DNA_END=1021 /DNA_ORIENTATION=-